jgi:hypothetical protein
MSKEGGIKPQSGLLHSPLNGQILTCHLRVKCLPPPSSVYHTGPIPQPDHCCSHRPEGSHYEDRTAVHELFVDFSVVAISTETRLTILIQNQQLKAVSIYRQLDIFIEIKLIRFKVHKMGNM